MWKIPSNDDDDDDDVSGSSNDDDDYSKFKGYLRGSSGGLGFLFVWVYCRVWGACGIGELGFRV
jgi:hypothetical protein